MQLRSILDRRLNRIQRNSDRLANLRALVFFVVGTLALVLVMRDRWGAGGLLGGGGLFLYIWIVGLHQDAESLRAKYTLRLRHLNEDQARAKLDWAVLPILSPPPSGVPAWFRDLDLVGEASLLRLMNQTVSERGLRALFEGFAGPSPDAEIQWRARIVRELKDKRLLRVRFRLACGDSLNSRELERLTSEPAHAVGAERWMWGLAALQLFALAATLLSIFYQWPPYYLAGWMAVFFFFRSGESRFHEPFERALAVEGHLRRFAKVTEVFEGHRPAPESALADLLAPFHAGGSPAALLRQLDRWASLLSMKGNPALHFLLNLLLPWDFAITLKLERTRQELASRLTDWLQALARFEAFLSLAGFSEIFDTETCWPELINGEPIAVHVEARGLGHPLIRRESRVRNDFSLTPSRACLLITGSNMSGKSTFLRTVGVNVLLARAGAKVFATSFRFRALSVRASLRTQDSLSDQVSTFYAEVKRLKEVYEEARLDLGEPVLYLIDEIFQGTNNRERLLGSRAYIEALLATRATGLIATHDLELSELESEHPRLHNLHFRETIENSKMHFSYELKDGPCPSTNALRIMALSGLPVPPHWHTDP